MSDIVETAVGDRVTDGRSSRMRAVGAALVIGAGAALLAYRLLRG
jgi:hypothetical protein